MHPKTMHIKIEEMWYLTINDDFKCLWLGPGSLLVGSLNV